ncbi:metalloregulator ArsR/SmtB family transcription factor [Candidatus Micrarchaeota archaeon]|nr:metalloregulator ArsR/SmtB family transcription factor [Candidatus Micrarchaeota archaeon]
MKQQLKLLKALANETRLKIVEFLLGGEQCVCKIYPCVKRSQPTISFQLSKLEDLGIVKQRRDGKYMYYSIADDKVKRVMIALNGGKKDVRRKKGIC